MKKRGLIICIVCVIILTQFFTACSKSSKDNQVDTDINAQDNLSENTSTEEGGNELTLPFKETLEFSYIGSIGSAYDDQNATAFLSRIAEMHNVKIDFTWVPSDGYGEKLIATIAGGDVPDLIKVSNINDLINQGAVIPLDDYLKYMPDYIKLLTDLDYVSMRNVEDGKMYHFRSMTDQVPQAMAMLIRKDWLDNLDMEIPKTWEEWLTVWKAFRDEDANGNGDPNDEIAFTDSPWNGAFSTLLPAFGIYAGGDFYLEGDTYSLIYEHPNYRDYLETMQMLYSENILDPETLTRSNSDIIQLFNTNVAGSGWQFASRAQSVTEVLIKENPNAVLLAVEPVKGPEGHQGIHQRSRLSESYAIGISAKNTGKVEKILTFINWVFTEEGMLTMNFGFEGETYDIKDGEPVLREPYINTNFRESRKYGLCPQIFPVRWSGEQFMQITRQGKDEDELSPTAKLMYDGLFVGEPYFYVQPPTINTEAWVKYSPDLIPLVHELRANCITGKITVDEFYSEYEKIKKNGLNEVIEQAQNAWNQLVE